MCWKEPFRKLTDLAHEQIKERPWRLDGLHGKDCISVPRTRGNDDLSTQTQSQIA